MLVALAAAHEPLSSSSTSASSWASPWNGSMAWQGLTARFRGVGDPDFGLGAVCGSAYRHPWCAPGAWQAWEASEPLPEEEVQEGRKARGEMLLC